MKKLFLAAGLLASFSSFAQVNASAMSVCDSIRQSTSYPERITQCLSIVNNASYDPQVVNLLRKFANSSTLETLNALKVSANATYDPGAIQVCDAIRVATSYADRVTECLRASANNYYDPSVMILARDFATASTLEANNIMKSAMNAYYMPEAVAVCDEIRKATSYTDRVTSCLNTIKNKIFLNGSESFCKSMANNSPLEAIKCLSQSAVEYVPAPTSRDLIITSNEIKDLKFFLSKARSQMERGMTAQAIQAINDALRTVQTVEASN